MMARFEWDPRKDAENVVKHGVPFAVAQYAFADPLRVIAQDVGHSSREARYFCFGRVARGIVTVRFTYRSGVIRIFGAGTGAKERPSMSAKIQYTSEPIGDPRVIKDFLPAPAELAFREEGVKITLTLSRKSVEFFKSEAAKADTQYQRMIRRLLDAYADAHAGQGVPQSGRRRTKTLRAA